MTKIIGEFRTNINDKMRQSKLEAEICNHAWPGKYMKPLQNKRGKTYSRLQRRGTCAKPEKPYNLCKARENLSPLPKAGGKSGKTFNLCQERESTQPAVAPPSAGNMQPPPIVTLGIFQNFLNFMRHYFKRK